MPVGAAATKDEGLDALYPPTGPEAVFLEGFPQSPANGGSGPS